MDLSADAIKHTRANIHTHTHTPINTEWNELQIFLFPTHTTAGAVKGPVPVWEALRCGGELIQN